MKNVKFKVEKEAKGIFSRTKTYNAVVDGEVVASIKTFIGETIDDKYSIFVESIIHRDSGDKEPLNRRVNNNTYTTLTEARKLRTKFVNDIKPKLVDYLTEV